MFIVKVDVGKRLKLFEIYIEMSSWIWDNFFCIFLNGNSLKFRRDFDIYYIFIIGIFFFKFVNMNKINKLLWLLLVM